MGKTAAVADPNEGLAQDAALATDLGDEKERSAAQLEYYGGDPIEDEDDLATLDRGDSLEVEQEDTDRGDEVPAEEEEEDDESEDEVDEADEAEDEIGDDPDDSDDEAEEESTDDDDSEDSEEEDEDEPKKPAEQRIPLSRFNEVNERMKAAERRLAELEGQQQAEEDAAENNYDFDAAEAEYMDLMLDGKTTEAAAKRREIRAAEKEEFLAESRRDTTQTVETDAAMRELNSLTSQAQQLYPVFDDRSDHYNPDIAAKTITFMRGYVADGLSASDAFVAALADSIDLFQLDGKPEPKTEKKKAPEKKAPIVKKKEKAALQKKQHRSPAGEGRGSADQGAAVPDITKLTDAEMDALSPEALARLRGDFVD